MMFCCSPSPKGEKREAMNKTWQDRSDDGWSCPLGDKLAISCQQKTPITIRDLHSLRNCCDFHHFDNTTRGSRWETLPGLHGWSGGRQIPGFNFFFFIHKKLSKQCTVVNIRTARFTHMGLFSLELRVTFMAHEISRNSYFFCNF